MELLRHEMITCDYVLSKLLDSTIPIEYADTALDPNHVLDPI